MKPLSGLYLLTHLVIIGIVNLFRFVLRYPISSLIIAMVILSNIFVIFSVIGDVLENGSNLNMIVDDNFTCQKGEPRNYNHKKIVLRIDDIQAFAWQSAQLEILDNLISRNIPATLGVIPFNIMTDPVIYKFLKKNNCRFDIAQHGWDHNFQSKNYDQGEFVGTGEAEAQKLIQSGRNELVKITEQAITTFIPPNNQYSLGTRQALIDLGYTIISADGQEPFDFTIATFDASTNKLTPIENIISECQEALEEKDLCIILIHPQDYTWQDRLNKYMFENYFIIMMDKLENLDAEFTTFSKLQFWYHLFP